MRIAGVGCLVVMLSAATLEAGQSNQSSLEAVSRGLQKPQPLSLDIPPIVSIPDETRRFGVFTLTTPDITRGEFFRVSVPVGEFVTGVAGKISKARYQRRERKAREAVARDLREFQAQQQAR